MKVLIIGNRVPYPLHDGGAIATYNLIKGLSDNDINVTFATLNTKKHFVEESIIQEKFTFLNEFKAFEIDTDVKITDAIFNLFSNKSYHLSRFYDIKFENQLIELIQNNQFDLIHFEGLYSAVYLKRLKEHCHCPVILRQHNIEHQIWERLCEKTKNPLKKWYLNVLSKRLKKEEISLFNQFDQLVSIADSDKVISNILAPNIPCKTIGIGFYFQASTINPDNNQLYHIGSMEWLPNRQAMEWFYHKVWYKLKKKHPNIHFFMAGKSMPSEYLNWNNKNFHVLDFVENLEDFTKDKQILVVPLLSGSGIRIKTIEGMFQGKSIVSTSIGAQGLNAIDKKHLLIADTEDEFVNAISELINNKNLKDELSKNAQEFAINNFSINHISNQWKILYSQLINKE